MGSAFLDIGIAYVVIGIFWSVIVVKRMYQPEKKASMKFIAITFLVGGAGLIICSTVHGLTDQLRLLVGAFFVAFVISSNIVILRTRLLRKMQ